MNLTIGSSKSAEEQLEVPGDKSISHRSLILSSIAEGESSIRGLLEADDCLKTLNIMRALGVSINKHAPGEYTVYGKGLDSLEEPENVLDCGNSGTGMRLISGLLSGQDFYSILTGDQSLRSRPMNRIIEPLSMMGVKIWSRAGGYAPLSIQGGELNSIHFAQKIASAQVKSCLLLAGLYAEGNTVIEEPAPSRDHTERMLASAGVEIEKSDGTIALKDDNPLIESFDIKIPGDISSASFLLAAGLLVPNSSIQVKNVGINSTRSGFLEVLDDMGAELVIKNKREMGGEPAADLKVETSDLRSVTVEGEIIPRMIDEIPILAVLATQAEGRTVINDAEELRVKETDRLSAITENLNKMGADIEEKEDGLIIEGPVDLKGEIALESFHDHRIAMASAVAGLIADGTVEILESEIINTSFPEFPKIIKNKFLQEAE